MGLILHVSTTTAECVDKVTCGVRILKNSYKKANLLGFLPSNSLGSQAEKSFSICCIHKSLWHTEAKLDFL